MDSAHFMITFLGSACTGQLIEKLVQRKRKLTPTEISFFFFAPVLVGVGSTYPIEKSGFTEWYRSADPNGTKDLLGTLAVLAIGMAAMWLVWALFSLLRKKPNPKATQPG